MEAVRYQYTPVSLCLDGRDAEAASAIISKGRFYGGAYMLAPDAKPGEPGFQVILFERSGAAASLLYGSMLPLNRLHRAPGVRVVRAEHVECVSGGRIPAQADGEPAGHTPLTVTTAAAPLRIVVRDGLAGC